MIAIVSFIIFLFSLYLLSRDDFIFLRKNVSLEQIFNGAFLTSLVALLTARISFVAFHAKPVYLNPLVFFLVPYFPGLILPGAVLGGLAFLLVYTRSKKMPTARIIDIFSLAFLFAFSFGALITALVDSIQRHVLVGGIFAAVGIISLVIAASCNKMFLKAKWADGAAAIWVLLYFSCISLLLWAGISFLQKKLTLNQGDVLSGIIIIGLFVVWIFRKRGVRKVV